MSGSVNLHGLASSAVVQGTQAFKLRDSCDVADEGGRCGAAGIGSEGSASVQRQPDRGRARGLGGCELRAGVQSESRLSAEGGRTSDLKARTLRAALRRGFAQAHKSHNLDIPRCGSPRQTIGLPPADQALKFQGIAYGSFANESAGAHDGITARPTGKTGTCAARVIARAREIISVVVRDLHAKSVGAIRKSGAARNLSLPSQVKLRGQRQLRQVAGVGATKVQRIQVPGLAAGLTAVLASRNGRGVGKDFVAGLLNKNVELHIPSAVLGNVKRNIAPALRVDDRRRARARAADRQLRRDGRQRGMAS